MNGDQPLFQTLLNYANPKFMWSYLTFKNITFNPF